VSGFTLEELSAMWGELGIEPDRVRSNGAAVAPVVIGEAEPLPDPVPARVVALLDEHAEAGTRSQRTLALVTACVRAGFTDAQILTAASRHQPTRDRHRSEQALCADVARCVGKARAAWTEYLEQLDDWIKAAGSQATADDEHTNPVVASLLDWPAFWRQDHNAEQWALEPLLANGRGHALYATAKDGKSLFVLSVVARAAAGMPALLRPGGEPLRVLYVDAEMTEADAQERLEDFGFGPETDLSALSYALLPSLAPLDTREGGAQLVEAALDRKAEVVVVDPLARTIIGEEDKADTLAAFNRWTGTALKRHGIAWLRVDHAGKDVTRGARGSSAKNDDVDVVWHLARTESGLLLKRTHSRIGWVPERVDVTIEADPLRHVVGPRSWPTGTSELAVELDRLEIPLDAGERRVRELAKGADPDFAARGTRLRAAIQFRREADWDAS
jgi:hypothetical protein